MIKRLFNKFISFLKRIVGGKGKKDSVPPDDFYPLF